MLHRYVIVYTDLVYSATMEEHIGHVRGFLARILQKAICEGTDM